MKALWRRRPVILTAFLLSLALMVFFGIRALVSTIYWNDPARANQPVADWMTPRYVVMAYRIPREALGDLLGLDPSALKRQSLAQIALQTGRTPQALIAEIEAMIADQRLERPQP
jgi:hypothetical protein